MIVVKKYSDGSRKVLYEVGDRVKLVKVGQSDRWLAKEGELATVTELERKTSRSSIDFFYVRTDAMVAGNWGALRVAPWDVELCTESA